jgi:hypothetical protein
VHGVEIGDLGHCMGHRQEIERVAHAHMRRYWVHS